MPEVFAYVKNQNLGFTIPYTLNGEEHNYYPDFIARIDDGYASPSAHEEGVGRGPGRGVSTPSLPQEERLGERRPSDLLNLVLECTGQKKKDKEAKVTTAQTLWIPAVNNHGEFGRWEFLEIDDPWDAKNRIHSRLKEMKQAKDKVSLEIRKTPRVCGGCACIGNTRIPVWLIVSFIKDNLADEALLQSYPQLTPDHLRLVRDYYDHHKEEIERVIAEQDEDEETLRHG
jgi:type III restriction enzyme